MAPNISGIDAADQAGGVHLCELALEFAKAHLKPRGTLLVKIFQGEGFDGVLKQMRASFESVRSEEHTSELQSLMRISYAVFFLKKKIIYEIFSFTTHT